MKKLTFLTIVVLLVGCTDDELIEYSALEGEKFTTVKELEKLAGVEIFNGNLRIESKDLESLESLNNLLIINGNLELYFNPKLENLDGLNNLRNVEGIRIHKNDNLENIDALHNIDEVERLELNYNNKLASLEGLGQITISRLAFFTGNLILDELGENIVLKDSSAYNVVIDENENLKKIDFLRGLKETEYLWITDNPILATEGAFNDLENVNEFRIENNSSIISLDLSSLRFFQDLYVFNNQGLTQIMGNHNGWLTTEGRTNITINSNEKLKSIRGFDELNHSEIIIRWNDSLEMITGFNSVDSVSLYIEGNPVLESFDIFQNSEFIFYDINFIDNESLSNYCGLNKLLESNIHKGIITTRENLYNPNQAMLLDGNCSN